MNPRFQFHLIRRLARHPRMAATVGVVSGLVTVACWNVGTLQNWMSSGTDTLPLEHASTDGTPRNPEESINTLRGLVERDGDDRTREAAIAWLDTSARGSGITDEVDKSFLLSMLETRGNAAWPAGYRRHLFNSTFNALRQGGNEPRLHRILVDMAVGEPDKTLRLYSIQHIGMERAVGRFDEAMAAEVHKLLVKFAAELDGEVAGLSVALLANWDDRSGMPPSLPDQEDILQTALTIAADRGNTLDNRVTAIHAAGPAVLPLARKIAVDDSEPLFVRKAAIALIGMHGEASDFAILEQTRGENFRLAQAAEPALKAIRHRIEHPAPRLAIPF